MTEKKVYEIPTEHIQPILDTLNLQKLFKFDKCELKRFNDEWDDENPGEWIWEINFISSNKEKKFKRISKFFFWTLVMTGIYYSDLSIIGIWTSIDYEPGVWTLRLKDYPQTSGNISIETNP